MTGVSNATFLKAINEGVIKPQLVKGRKKAMYLESEVLKIVKKKKITLTTTTNLSIFYSNSNFNYFAFIKTLKLVGITIVFLFVGVNGFPITQTFGD